MELLIVIATIAVLAAIGGLSYISMQPSLSLSGASKQIQTEFLAARMNAVSQNNRFRVYFLNDHEYKILDDQNSDNDEDVGETYEIKDIRTHYPGVTLSANNDPIFTPNGSVKSSATVTLTNTSGSRQVVVSSAGFVRIE